MNLYLGNSLMDYRGPAEWDKVTLVTLQMGCGQDMEHHKSYYRVHPGCYSIHHHAPKLWKEHHKN